MKTTIEYQDQFGIWRRFTTMNHEPSAFQTASSRARSSGKRHRLVDEDGRLLDLIDP